MDEATKQLLGYGISGALNFLLMGVVVYLFKELRAAGREHKAEMAAMVERYVAKSDKWGEQIREQTAKAEASFDRTQGIFSALAGRLGKQGSGE